MFSTPLVENVLIKEKRKDLNHFQHTTENQGSKVTDHLVFKGPELELTPSSYPCFPTAAEQRNNGKGEGKRRDRDGPEEQQGALQGAPLPSRTLSLYLPFISARSYLP
ncbi:uncharacterized protein PHA67_016091 isoform 1-T1 [Liasis olivaceus]